MNIRATSLLTVMLAIALSMWDGAAARPFSKPKPLTLEALVHLAELGTAATSSCPCSNVTWCQPLTSPKPARELFVYSPNEEMYATSYNWSKITTVVTYGFPHPEMVCYAHQRGVRVVFAFGTGWAVASNPQSRSLYAQQVAAAIAAHGLDGINLDFEQLVPSPTYNNYMTSFYYAIVKEVRAVNPNAQLSVCIGSFSIEMTTPYQYDFAAILHKADFLMAMMYDNSPVMVGANSYAIAIDAIFKGLYSLASMAPSQLVLGFPWYGYEYSCINDTMSNGNCLITSGVEVNYDSIVQILSGQNPAYTNISAVTKNLSPLTGTFVTFSANCLTDKKTPNHIFVFDDVDTLQVKYELAMSSGAKGLSMWNAGSLGNSTVAPMPQHRQQMWEAINSYF